MPLDQRIRKLGTPFYGLLKKKSLFSNGKRSSVVKTYSRVVRALLNVHWGPSPVPSLPVELWMKIVHDLSHREWIALSSVCWLLYQIAQPRLYENIILLNWENLREISNQHQSFKRTVDQRPELGAYVRSLTLAPMDDRPGLNDRERYPLLFKLYLFPNLESLHAWYINFNLELCSILHSHPRLKSVTVTSCTLDESFAITPMDKDHFPHSSITKVKITQPKHNPMVHTWAALAPAKLESLEVQSRTSPAFDAALILNRIRELKKTSFLATLSLDMFSPAAVRFLIASPQLRHLTLSARISEDDMSSSLPVDAIPFLEEYSGPAEISSTLIRGRPVHRVKFISGGHHRTSKDRLVEGLISLQYCSVPLTSLELALFEMTVGSWLSHIPDTVHHLKFRWLYWSDLEKWLPALSHLTSLQTLSGRFSQQADRKLRREEIKQISNTCQSLREINIGRRRWRLAGQRGWEPFRVAFMDDV